MVSYLAHDVPRGGFMEKKEELICDEMSQRIIETAEKIALENGVEGLNVRKILKTLGISNRVFYNRFKNISEVLDIVYEKTVLKIRESITAGVDPAKDFFEQVTEMVANTLMMSYDNKMNLNSYVFENDSVSRSNFEWWHKEIIKLIEYAKSEKLFKDVDSDAISYAIWCFCRGYNADAVSRNLPRDKAVENFKYSFGFLLEGLKR